MPFKKVSSTQIIIALLGVNLLFFSCADKCKKLLCQNGSTCLDGTCICAKGYEGEDCSVKTIDKFAGTYNAVDLCTATQNPPYTVNISAISDDNLFEVYIANFENDFSNKVVATILQGTQLKIEPQAPDGDGRIITGQGQFQGTKITWSYSINDTYNGQINTCSSTWEK